MPGDGADAVEAVAGDEPAAVQEHDPQPGRHARRGEDRDELSGRVEAQLACGGDRVRGGAPARCDRPVAAHLRVDHDFDGEGGSDRLQPLAQGSGHGGTGGGSGGGHRGSSLWAPRRGIHEIGSCPAPGHSLECVEI